MGIAKSGELFDSPDFLHVSIFLLQLCIVFHIRCRGLLTLTPYIIHNFRVKNRAVSFLGPRPCKK